MEELFNPEAYRMVRNIMIGFAIFYVLFEVALNLNELEDDTSNIILLDAAKKQFFFIPFALGAILGHLFIGTTNKAFYIGDGWPVYILFALAIICTIIGYKVEFKKPLWFLCLLLLLGLAYGHFLWSLNFD
ncbi:MULTISPECIES: hypothetical protein [Flavobacteriaceae]|uniref:hypothetical protein n=1 Tax=Flavobacteriaceae TaxID=49546 RepID=UPI0010AE2C48|nr:MULTISPECIES: hypothetical protein [Flavobacteriaceae]NJB35877.1 hypothetical protein [Croceivirga sp. JEA036]TKD65836.1 hypothetical protein FBT53_02925 [Flavobacterium sp. ASW18X]